MRYIFLSITLILMLLSIEAQNINSLRKQQKQAKQKIDLTNKLLNETQKNQKSTVNSLTVLQRQISERETLINALNSEIGILDNDLNKLSTEINVLEDRLSSLKNEYANLLYHAYFFKTEYNKYLFVFSASSFNQAVRRWRYVEQYSRYRKEQSIRIQQITNELRSKEDELASTINSKSTVLKGKEVENQALQKSRNNKQQMLSKLGQKEKELRADLAKQQKQAKQLNDKIQELIAKEIEKQRKAEEARKAAEAKKAAEAAARAKRDKQDQPIPIKPVEKTSAAKPSSQEELIAGGFEKNMGRLPFPTRGVIIGRFGLQKHPVLSHVEVDNKGIYIQAEAGAEASAVYQGEVTQIFSIPGSNNAIIVKHGTYRSVYTNLTNIYVKVGDKVTAKQKLGKIFVDEENDNKTELYFMIYKNSTPQDPEKWLSR